MINFLVGILFGAGITYGVLIKVLGYTKPVKKLVKIPNGSEK